MNGAELAIAMNHMAEQGKKKKLDRALVGRFLEHVQSREPESRAYWVTRVYECRSQSGKENLMRGCLGE